MARWVGVVVVVAMIWAGVALWQPVAGQGGGLTIAGDVVIYGSLNGDVVGVGWRETRCVGGADGDFDGYVPGADVELYDQDDELVGTGSLEAGYFGSKDTPMLVSCVMTFEAREVAPADAYGVVIDGVLVARLTRGEIEASRWFISIEAG